MDCIMLEKSKTIGLPLGFPPSRNGPLDRKTDWDPSLFFESAFIDGAGNCPINVSGGRYKTKNKP